MAEYSFNRGEFWVAYVNGLWTVLDKADNVLFSNASKTVVEE